MAKCKIRTKTRGITDLVVNRAQTEAIHRVMAIPGKKRIAVLKARQLGMSTLIQAWAYAKLRSENHTRAITISAESDATARLLEMSRFFIEHDPTTPPMRTNRLGAIEFADTRSSHYIATAGGRSVGRGDTLQYIHGSEVAFWPDAEKTMTGLGEALAPEGYVFAESTPNGLGGYFYELCNEAPHNGWTMLFFPWWYDDGYTLEIADLDELLPFTDEEQYLIDTHGLTVEQIAWRRDKHRTLKKKAIQEYPEDPVTCFLTSGSPYFSPETLTNIHRHDICEPLRDDGRGLRTWVECNPEHNYVVVGDPAEGLKGGDFSVAQVLDVATGEQAAVLRGLWSPHEFAKMAVKLAVSYGHAHLAFERNNHGHSCLNTAVNTCGYTNLYRHEEYTTGMGEVQKKLGFPTTQQTKPVVLQGLDEALEQRVVVIHDEVTWNELTTMHWDGKGGVSAAEGCHDDCVMSLAIANFVRKIPARFQRSMDYFNAVVVTPGSDVADDEDMQAQLIREQERLYRAALGIVEEDQ